MNDIIVSAVVILTAAGIMGSLVLLSPKPADRPYVFGSFAMHMFCAFAMRIIIDAAFGGVADIYMFLDAQRSLRPILVQRPWFGVVEITKLIFQLPNEVSTSLDATTSIIAATALGMWGLNDSQFALFFACAFLGFLGKWGIYAALRDELRPAKPGPLAFCCLMLPSCVFWTSGLVKEAFAICGLGALTRGAQLFLRGGRPLLALPLIGIGFGLTGAFKPFLLFGFVIALGTWLFFEKVRSAPVFAPILLVVAVAIAIVGFALLGARYKNFAFDKLGDSMANTQMYAAQAGGGSHYELGDATQRSTAGQIAFAPIAIVTVLMRPLPFEVHNVTSAIAAAELAVLNLLLFRTFRRAGLRAMGRNLFQRPILLFALTFVLAAGTGIGLATGNFGSLSRYRTPILPFYAMLVVVGLGAPAAVARSRAASSPASRLLPPHVVARRKLSTRAPAGRGRNA